MYKEDTAETEDMNPYWPNSMLQGRANNEQNRWLHNLNVPFFHHLMWFSVSKNPPGKLLRFGKRIGQFYKTKKSSQLLDNLLADKIGWRKSGSVTSD